MENLEQKYQEALKRAKELYDAGNDTTKQHIGIIFPELTESEDERIRKEIIDFLKQMAGNGNLLMWVTDEIDDCLPSMLVSWIAWLEKQKEQNEPMSEDLSEEINRISKIYPEISFAKLSRIAVHFAKWKQKESLHIPETKPSEKEIEELYKTSEEGYIMP